MRIDRNSAAQVFLVVSPGLLFFTSLVLVPCQQINPRVHQEQLDTHRVVTLDSKHKWWWPIKVTFKKQLIALHKCQNIFSKQHLKGVPPLPQGSRLIFFENPSLEYHVDQSKDYLKTADTYIGQH